MAVIGFINWNIQEYIAPNTNQMQDSLRSQIRNLGVLDQKEKKFWVANGQRIYAFESAEKESEENRRVSNLTVYEFLPESNKLSGIYFSPTASWQKDKVLLEQTRRINISNETITKENLKSIELDEPENPFDNLSRKPSHLSAAETRKLLAEIESESEYRVFKVALHKKYATLFLPFLISLFTLPFALSLRRQGKVSAIGYAVAVWLIFMGGSSFFEQAGLNGSLSPVVAVWSPLFLFSVIGVYLLTKIRT
jgi:lipopolysaccharide export LptBFGC system permease protein LptF